MSIREKLQSYKSNSPEQKLQALRSSMFVGIGTIRGITEYIRLTVEPEKVSGLPEDFWKWIDQIHDEAVDLHEILDVLTSKEDSSAINNASSQLD